MRGFSDAERERIRLELLAVGRELFGRYGLDKTTIADLTEPVGIANSTFYQFFDSKEELYFRILQAEGEELAEAIVRDSLASVEDPQEAIETFLTLLVAEIETNPLVQQLLLEDALEDVRGEMTEAELVAEREAGLAYLVPFIERWQETGQVRAGDPATLAATLSLVKTVTLYREDLGEALYPDVRDTFIEVVAAGLTRTDE